MNADEPEVLEARETFAVERVAIEELTPFPFDLREHDLGAISVSLDTFGQPIPIVAVRHEGRNVIIAGKGRYLAAKQLGWTHLWVHFEPWRPEMAGAFAIADNRTSERGRPEDDGLAALLAQLRREDERLFAATGYDDDDLVRMAAEIERENERMAAALGEKGPNGSKPRTVECPNCGQRFTVKKGR